MANTIFLAIETGLFAAGDVAVMTGGHIPFFLANTTILLVKTGSLRTADLPFPAFLVNTVILIVQAGIDLLTTGMLAGPFPILGERICRNTQQGDKGGGK
jgi:hypothetical protein